MNAATLDLAGAIRALRQCRGELYQERAAAAHFVKRLEAQPSRRHRWMIANSRLAGSWALAEGLIGFALGRVAGEVERAGGFATLAVEVAQRYRQVRFGDPRSADLLSRALTTLGHTALAAGSAGPATRAFEEAEAALLEGSLDSLEVIFFLDHRVSLMAVLCRLVEAEISRSRAEVLALEIGDFHRVGRLLLKRGALLACRRRRVEALECLQAGSELLDRRLEPFLLFSARLWMADLLVAEGRCLQARALVEGASRIEGEVDPALSKVAAGRRWIVADRLERRLRGGGAGAPALLSSWPADL